MSMGIPIVGTVPGPYHPERHRIRRLILRHLKVHGEMPTTMLLSFVVSPDFSRADIERTLCDLSTEGIVIARRAAEPHRFGGIRPREFTYWRLAEGA